MKTPADRFDFDFNLTENSTTKSHVPPGWAKWYELIAACPEIKKLLRCGPNETPPPRVLSRMLFLGLIACFADPVMGEILRAVMLHHLAPDILDMLFEPDTEDGK